MLWPWSTIKKLRRELALAVERGDEFRAFAFEYQADNRILEQKLVAAQKNDTRDPNTGRYVKADQS